MMDDVEPRSELTEALSESLSEDTVCNNKESVNMI